MSTWGGLKKFVSTLSFLFFVFATLARGGGNHTKEKKTLGRRIIEPPEKKKIWGGYLWGGGVGKSKMLGG